MPAGQNNVPSPLEIFRVVTIAVTILAFGCDKSGQSGSSASSTPEVRQYVPRLEDDPVAVADVARINRLIASKRMILPSDQVRLESLWKKYRGQYDIYNGLFDAYFLQKDWKSLAELLDQVPEDKRDNVLYGLSLSRAHRYDDARKVLATQLDSHVAQNQIRLYYAKALYHLGESDKALEVLLSIPESAAEEDIQEFEGGVNVYAETLNFRGLIALRKNETREARNLLAMALKIDPENLTTLTTLARVVSTLGELDLAKNLERKAQSVRNQERSDKDAGLLLGTIIPALEEAMNKGHYDQAAKLIDQVYPLADEEMIITLNRYRGMIKDHKKE